MTIIIRFLIGALILPIAALIYRIAESVPSLDRLQGQKTPKTKPFTFDFAFWRSNWFSHRAERSPLHIVNKKSWATGIFS